MHCARPRDYHICLGLTRIQFHPPKVTPLTNPANVTDQGLCYCNSDAWGWHNSRQNGVIIKTDQLIFQNGKNSDVYRRNNNGFYIDRTERPIPTEQSLRRMSRWSTLSKAALKSICTIRASCPLSNALCSVWDAQKCITGTQTLPISKLGG